MGKAFSSIGVVYVKSLLGARMLFLGCNVLIDKWLSEW